MVEPVVKRQAVAHLRAVFGMSERRACAVIGADRKSMRYRSRRGVRSGRIVWMLFVVRPTIFDVLGNIIVW